MGFWSTIGNIGKAIVNPVKTVYDWATKENDQGNSVASSVGSMATAAAPVIGSMISANSAKSINQQQIEQSEKLFTAQKQETDTSHVREIADLKAAGLNPILSAKYGGSASATGVMPNLKQPYQDAGKDFSSASQLNLSRKMTSAQINTEKTKQNLNSAGALKQMADAIAQRYRNRKAGASLGSYENTFYKNILSPAQRFKESFSPFSAQQYKK